MELKKTVKYDGKLKDIHFENGILLDSNDEPVDLYEILSLAFENSYFTLTTTTKTEEVIDLDEVKEQAEHAYSEE